MQDTTTSADAATVARLDRVLEGIAHLKQARDLFDAAGSPNIGNAIRQVLKRADGAMRAAKAAHARESAAPVAQLLAREEAERTGIGQNIDVMG